MRLCLRAVPDDPSGLEGGRRRSLGGVSPERRARGHLTVNTNGRRPLLQVEDLVVRYPISRGFVGSLARRPQRAVHAVEGVTLKVEGGELLALVGESGCGKTTTAQAVLRLVDSESGSIRFE